MAVSDSAILPARRGLRAFPIYYGWVIVLMSALAMLATLPGRTHGLGMITERLVNDFGLHLDSADEKVPVEQSALSARLSARRVLFGDMNFWATLLGAAFCLPCGTLLDRYGIRLTLTVVTALLGLVVLAMTQISDFWLFFAAILLTRGLGQSALSVVSLSMAGKWFSRRLSLAMGVFTVLMALGFITAFTFLREYMNSPWQTVWSGLGYALLFGIAPLSLLLVRNTPEEYGLPVDGMRQASAPVAGLPPSGYTLQAALAEPAFWAFALATSMYGLISSGVSLWNEDVLIERGFTKETYYQMLKIGTGLGLAGNLLAGGLVHWTSLRKVMALSMALLAGALFGMPYVSTFPQLMAYAVGMSLGGGMMTVVFFTAFGQCFGRLHLGQIQGIAQMLTVFASAAGPVALARTKVYWTSYMPFFYASGVIVLALGAWACFLRMPAPIKTAAELELAEWKTAATAPTTT